MTAHPAQAPASAARGRAISVRAQPLPPGAFDGRAFLRALVEAGDIGDTDQRLAQEVARQNATSELHALLELGLIGEEALCDRLAAYTGWARWRAAAETASPASHTPEAFMRASSILVFDDADPGAFAAVSADDPGLAATDSGAAALRLVVADPSDRFAWGAALSRFSALASSVRVAVGTQKEIRQFLDERAAPAPGEAGEADRAARSGDAIDVSGELSALRDMASEAPVIRFFNQCVERAVELAASDIHIERFDRRISIRYRVDGLLIDQPPPPATLFEALMCRVKILANLDIAERRKGQDGRIRMRLRGRALDLRVSIVPTMYGQDAAIRLQDRQRLADVTLESLGFSETAVNAMKRSAGLSHGIVLITGPTGSGKTTSLYALLRTIVKHDTKIVTVEDPVEYAMDGVNQIQINPAVGMTFGTTLRHVLRHDPDVILIGEIRDRETAEIAFQAALTGHLVLSTLHTNDVPSSFTRLVDIGVEPFLVNAAVEAVFAQRLVRKRCERCRNQPAQREGCPACGGIGYRGRIAISEYATPNAQAKRLLVQGADADRIREALVGGGYRTLRDDAERLIETGVTDREEVIRALGHAAEAEQA